VKNALRISFGILFLISIYLIPTGVAMLRRAPSIGSTAVINALLGWSVIGWIVSLAMAFRGETR
jgi:Superinfection immunity protein